MPGLGTRKDEGTRLGIETGKRTGAAASELNSRNSGRNASPRTDSCAPPPTPTRTPFRHGDGGSAKPHRQALNSSAGRELLVELVRQLARQAAGEAFEAPPEPTRSPEGVRDASNFN